MKKTVKFAGFTLIELLIVIGLLAALASVLLPSLMGSREDALEGICSYNQAGSLRTLRQFEAMTGKLPSGFHTGLQDSTTAVTSVDGLMPGFAPAFLTNVSTPSIAGNVQTLASHEAEALKGLGITELAYGTGDASKGATTSDALGYESVTDGLRVICVDPDWTNDGELNADPYSFNGRTVQSYLDNEGYTKVVALFITPTVNWEKESTGWVKGFSVKLEITGTCPIPQTDFAYYVAYVGIRGEGYYVNYGNPSGGAEPIPSTFPTFAANESAASTALTAAATGSWVYTPADGKLVHTSADSTPVVTTYNTSIVYKDAVAKLLGTSCPECGITNP
ncbi:MAG: prepilin-type N-terminal cleavage/methylation domain-containing protein [Planctomycetaceae bacterium]|jgi:prepilin-type N-terminal cleavage/methylation domain-containing protein|nr:prepilin-type N-terminal cleavage/methylation domain-containing protein [Planctomycetaceae bacterium]